MLPNCSRSVRSATARGGRLAYCGVVPALLLGSAFCAPAWAALGDAVGSVTSDSQVLAARAQVAKHAAFTVQELHTPTGAVIRDFITPSGVVFAVSWRGPFKPSMALLLGRYFGDYARAPRSPGSTRSRLVIEQPQLVVHAGGHMRSFAGIAYVPQLLPAHVTEADLQ